VTVPTPSVAERIAAQGGHHLRFEVGQAAWISIVDGKGQRFSKLVPTGGREVFRGEPPFRLVVGEAAQVRLTYDGHLIDLTPYIGQKVARLTLE
jgi:cytoskeleton protein RodZ